MLCYAIEVEIVQPTFIDTLLHKSSGLFLAFHLLPKQVCFEYKLMGMNGTKFIALLFNLWNERSGERRTETVMGAILLQEATRRSTA